MKLAFLLLLLANLLLYAWQQDVFGRYTERGREPERLERQIEPERFQVLSEGEVKQLRARAEQPRAANTPTLPQACVEFGDFAVGEAGRAETALAAAGLKATARTVDLPGYWIVYLPPSNTRAEAERRAAGLRNLGVADLLVVTDDGPLRHGIRLGAFRDPEAAQAHLTALGKMGVAGARIGDRPTAPRATRFQLRDISADAARQLGVIRKEFPSQTLSAC